VSRLHHRRTFSPQATPARSRETCATGFGHCQSWCLSAKGPYRGREAVRGWWSRSAQAGIVPVKRPPPTSTPRCCWCKWSRPPLRPCSFIPRRCRRTSKGALLQPQPAGAVGREPLTTGVPGGRPPGPNDEGPAGSDSKSRDHTGPRSVDLTTFYSNTHDQFRALRPKLDALLTGDQEH
jgi:hypothetical protein